MNQDFFAKIAMEHHPVGKDELIESDPICFERKLFKPSTSVCGRVEEKSYDAMLKEFGKELCELKEKFRPFTENFTPDATIIRKSTELKEFSFRFQNKEDRTDIHEVLDGRGEWERVVLPDYRGPMGKWTGYYRTVFRYVLSALDKRVFLKFLGVDYIANVYLNDRYIGSHEGFFAPFEFDVTDFLSYDGENILLVELKNDIPTVGLDGEDLDGDKIYAATGLGWDDPKVGWHHCPPGAGIYNRVMLEERSSLFIESVFVRPDIDSSLIEVRAQVFNTFNVNKEMRLSLSVHPFNFKKESLENITIEGIKPAGPGINYYRFTVDMTDFRLWRPEEPWLYYARVSLVTEEGCLEDQGGTTFGMRKFHMDEIGEEKGTLYLNNRRIILRGANDMGHMQLCVMRGDFEQLTEDILIAKLANMNYYRFTQRPVQEEIYQYCDMLGMMNQTDLPLFGQLRRNQFCEALRQTGEMERLIRNHPSSIMVTYINEPFPIGRHKKGHRHLYRDELENFFKAADCVVKVENPDRVIKHVEGDYDPPTGYGLSDFHCYNMWYTNHALPIGKLYKGFLPETKKGWKSGCGEYGTEGLDNYEVMMKLYPQEWIPSSDVETWIPDRIMLAQTNSMHGDWYEEQHHIRDWIRESQEHQAFATTLMTDAMRRRSDKLISTAVHLLIDAWPSGWMKTLVGVDRIPKPSYFSYRKCLEPVRVNMRCDRWTVREEEEIEVEAWLLNDTAEELGNCRIVAVLRDIDREYGAYETFCDGKAACPTYAGSISVRIPAIEGRKKIFLDAALYNADGKTLNMERFTIQAFQQKRRAYTKLAFFIGSRAYRLLSETGIKSMEFRQNLSDCKVLVVSDQEAYIAYMDLIKEKVGKGMHVIFLLPDQGKGEWEFDGRRFNFKKIFGEGYADGVNEAESNGLFFIARDARDARTGSFLPKDFSYWYNAEKDYMDAVAVSYIDSEDISPLLFSYKKPSFFERAAGGKTRLPVVGEMAWGQGKVIFSSLCFENRIRSNPILEDFLWGLF